MKPNRKTPAQLQQEAANRAAIHHRIAAAERSRKMRNQLLTVLGLGIFGGVGVLAYMEFRKPGAAATAGKTQVVTLETTGLVEGGALDAATSGGETNMSEQGGKTGGNDASAGLSEGGATSGDASGQGEVKESVVKVSFDQEPLLVLTGMDATRAEAEKRDEELFKKAVDGESWASYRALLSRSLEAALKTVKSGTGLNRFDPVWNEPVLYRALLRWKALGVFSEEQIRAHVLDVHSSGFMRWLLHDNAAMEELAEVVDPRDDGSGALKLLMDAWALTDGKFENYFPLALAHAVVFDEEMAIPNQIGNEKFPAEAVVDPIKRFRWYVEKDQAGKLAGPIRSARARDLIWVVSAPVTTAEMEWAIGNVHGSRKNWGSNYGKITYLMERAVEGKNPYKEYSFAEILKEGGICGDQSYFCVNTARAQGIPAIVLSGETDLGGHAWAAVKTGDREWDTTVGRIGGVSKGQTASPQTGDPVTEQEIQLWNDRAHLSPATRLAVFRHIWLADFQHSLKNADARAEAIRLANRIGPSFTETWHELYRLLRDETKLSGNPEIPVNLEDWKNFARDMRREFKENPRMAELAASAESEYIFPYGAENDARRTLTRQRRRIERDSGEQKDLIATSLKREAELLAKSPDGIKEITRLYDRALRDYGGSITGFKMMAEDYYGFCKGDKELARKAARDIELAFKRTVESGTKEWFRAKTEAGIYEMIIGYYREAGDASRADLLEKRMETLARRAKRGAL